MPVLVTDFDGTFARRDFYELILERHDPPGARVDWQRFIDGEASLSTALSAVFGALRTDERGADELVAALDPAPGAAEAARRLQRAGWDIVVASAGCAWYIERLLQRMDLDFTVHATPGRFELGAGLVTAPDPHGPFFHPVTGIDKAAVVRAALQRDPVVACAGDSETDRAPNLLVPAERRFATGRLARRFAAEGVPHPAFTVWPEIADHLLGG